MAVSAEALGSTEGRAKERHQRGNPQQRTVWTPQRSRLGGADQTRKDLVASGSVPGPFWRKASPPSALLLGTK